MNTLQNENVEEEPEEYPGFICMLYLDVYMTICSIYAKDNEFRYLRLESAFDRRSHCRSDYNVGIKIDDESIRWCFEAYDIIQLELII